MGLQKNVSGQKWIVFAFDVTDNTPKTGDAAQITANLRIDGAGADAVDDTNPTELEDGFYIFDLTQGETNGDYIVICPASSTGDIQVIGCPMAQYTSPPNFNTLSISSGRVDIGSIKGIDAETRLFELAKNSVNLLSNGGFETGDPPSNWTLVGAGASFAQSGVQKKAGSYSGLLTRSGADCYVYQNITAYPYAGITVIAAVWVYTTVASRARLWFGTDVAGDYSDYHTGGSGQELLIATHEVEDTASIIQLQCRIDNGDTSAYFDEAVAAAPFNDLTAAEIKTAIEAGGSHLALIKAKTDNLPTDPADESLIEAAIAALNNVSTTEVQTAAAAALTAYDPPTKAEMDASIAAAHATTDALIGALNNLSAAQVWAYATRVLTANTNLNDPSAATIADAVWEELIADHSGTAGSTAEQLAAAGGAADPWNTALPGAYTTGKAGNILGNIKDSKAIDL